MTINVKDGGVWKEATMYVKDGGTWKAVQEGYIKDAGTWKQFLISRATLNYTFSSNTANASLNLSGISGYISGKSDITVTVNSGVYLYATSTGNYGLNITGGTTGDTLTIVNNGYIMGQGGNGGGGDQAQNPNISPTAGGPALNLGFGMSSCTINNTNASAYIGGGGGGGGSNGYAEGAGGGAGGGTGGTGRYNSNNPAYAGGAGGSPGNAGSDGTQLTIYLKSGAPVYNAGGGGGGRIFPGSGGASGNASGGKGFGGGAGGGAACVAQGNGAGAGGSANNAGQAVNNGSGGGGGWGASGGNGRDGSGTRQAGASGGKAVNLNGKSVTWTSGDTTRVWGTVS